MRFTMCTDANNELLITDDINQWGSYGHEHLTLINPYCKAEESVIVPGNLVVLGSLYATRDLQVGGDCIIFGTLYWGSLLLPEIGGRFYHNLVLTPVLECYREYWQSRLGMNLSEGCVDEIIAKVRPELPKLLRSRKWTPVERLMLESLKEQEHQQFPEWVIVLARKHGLMVDEENQKVAFDGHVACFGYPGMREQVVPVIDSMLDRISREADGDS